MSPFSVLVTAVCAGAAAACLLPGPTVPVRRAGHPGSKPRPAPVRGQGLARFRPVLAACAGLGAGVLLGGWPGLVTGTAATLGTWWMVGRLESPSARRRRIGLTRELPQVVDLLACCLTAGSSTSTSVEMVAAAVPPPMRDELRVISSRLGLGVDPTQVWSDVARHPELGTLGRCLVRALDSGSSVSGAMHRLADDLRRSTRAEVEGRARSVGSKAAAPLGLCLLPAFILIGVVPVVAASLSGLLSF